MIIPAGATNCVLHELFPINLFVPEKLFLLHN